jgi:hypothetical protein
LVVLKELLRHSTLAWSSTSRPAPPVVPAPLAGVGREC